MSIPTYPEFRAQSHDMSGIPEWAKQRALALFRDEASIRPLLPGSIWEQAFARFIAAHEQPPVDPIHEVLEKVFGCCSRAYLAKFHVELVKHGLQIISTGATK